MGKDIYHANGNTAGCDDSFFDGLCQVIDALSRLTNAGILLYDFDKRTVIHQSEKLKYVDEATASDIQRKSSNPYWSLVTPTDLNVLLDIEKAYFHILRSFSPEQQLKHTLVINFNIYLKQKEHIVTQKYTPVSLRQDGTPRIGLLCIAPTKNETSERAAIFGNGFRYAYDSKERDFFRFSSNLLLTNKEKAILSLASKGFSTNQIANELCRSLNTIKTHKKRIFEKLQVSTMAEAVMLKDKYNL